MVPYDSWKIDSKMTQKCRQNHWSFLLKLTLSDVLPLKIRCASFWELSRRWWVPCSIVNRMIYYTKNISRCFFLKNEVFNNVGKYQKRQKRLPSFGLISNRLFKRFKRRKYIRTFDKKNQKIIKSEIAKKNFFLELRKTILSVFK